MSTPQLTQADKVDLGQVDWEFEIELAAAGRGELREGSNRPAVGGDLGGELGGAASMMPKREKKAKVEEPLDLLLLQRVRLAQTFLWQH